MYASVFSFDPEVKPFADRCSCHPQALRKDKLGRTPLHNAVAAGCDELAKGLLEEKAWAWPAWLAEMP